MTARGILLVASLTVTGIVVAAQSPAEREMLARIRAEGIERSQALPVFEMLTHEIGPRLTASPGQKRASEWVRSRSAAYGLSNARLEPWKFGRGWTLERLTVEMIEPRYLPLIAYADGWSAATAGEIVAAPVFVGGKTPDEAAGDAGATEGRNRHDAADAHQFRSARPAATERCGLRSGLRGLCDERWSRTEPGCGGRGQPASGQPGGSGAPPGRPPRRRFKRSCARRVPASS